jgi:hypothetical protein
MKKINSPISDFYIPDKRYCFWVGAVMQTVAPGNRKKRNTMPYIYVVILLKITENTLLQ